MRKTLFLIAILLLLPLSVMAQDLTETYTTPDGSLSVNYPADWLYKGTSSSVTFANSQTALDKEVIELSPGEAQIGVYVFPPDVLADLLVSIDADSALGVAEAYIADVADDLTILEAPVQLDLDQDSAILSGIDDNVESILIFSISEQSALYLVGVSTPIDESSQYRELLIEMTKSVHYTPPAAGAGFVIEDTGEPAIEGTSNFIWQQQRPSGVNDGEFNDLGNIFVTPDDTIYIADNFIGIQVLDSDGNVLHRLDNPEINNVTDMVVSGDGSLWVIDGFSQQIYHLDENANLLGTVGEAGSGAGQFGEQSPSEIELGSDGNLYVFDPQGGAGRVEVFDLEGNFLREFAADPNGEDNLYSVPVMAIAPDGNVYLGEDGLITVFDPQGNLLLQIELPSPELDYFHGIAVDESGAIYLTGDGGLYTYRDGSGVTKFGNKQADSDLGEAPPFEMGEFNYPGGVAVLSNGRIVIADSNFSYVQVVLITFG